MVMLRPGARTTDHIAYQTGSTSERYMNVELGVFRPNTPLTAQQDSARPRRQKKGSAVQEYFEQLMMCKCE
jgi:hypothetical protein